MRLWVKSFCYWRWLATSGVTIACVTRLSMSMASSSARSGAAGAGDAKKKLGFLANAMKRKDNFIQLFAMTGILLLSMRSLGQKYRIHGLEEDTHALREEHNSLTDRMNNIKRELLHEASQDSTGLFASRLRNLFNEQH